MQGVFPNDGKELPTLKEWRTDLACTNVHRVICVGLTYEPILKDVPLIYALFEGIRTKATAKGQSALCSGCGSIVSSVIPRDKVSHWRHKASDCDNWHEPETHWHLSWKDLFEPSECEVSFTDQQSGEKHRADVAVLNLNGERTVVEFQHSNISDEEIKARNTFYGSQGRFFWVVHLDDSPKGFRSFNFRQSIGAEEQFINGKKFWICNWAGKSNTFIDRWKNQTEHVFLSLGQNLYYLATKKTSPTQLSKLKSGEFLITKLSIDRFIESTRT